jgi:hypothetical protein
MGREKRNAYRILVGKPEGKRPLRRARRRWVDNIKTELREIGWGGMYCTHLAKNRDQWRAPAKVNGPSGSIILWRIHPYLRGDSVNISPCWVMPARNNRGVTMWRVQPLRAVTSHNRSDAGGVLCRTAPRLYYSTDRVL